MIVMDLAKIQVRQDLERMVINYFLLGKISKEQSDKIADYVDSVIGGGYLPEPTRGEKIICFPGVMLEERPQEPPKAPEQPKLSLDEHRKGFEGVQFGAYYHTRIMWTLYNLHIRSLEELAKTPVNTLLRQRNMGQKTIEHIRTVLENRGFTLGKDWELEDVL
jgi:hypothetical protein